jgi:hypothetical protein
MTERLDQRYLEFVAQTIDDQCERCHQSEQPQFRKMIRKTIKYNLKTLGGDWDKIGVDGTNFTNNLIASCDQCFMENRVLFALDRLTCGIRTRQPELPIEGDK